MPETVLQISQPGKRACQQLMEGECHDSCYGSGQATSSLLTMSVGNRNSLLSVGPVFDSVSQVPWSMTSMTDQKKLQEYVNLHTAAGKPGDQKIRC